MPRRRVVGGGGLPGAVAVPPALRKTRHQ